MKENELEVFFECTNCKSKFYKLEDMLVYYIPRQIIEELHIKQAPHLKCPNCRNNTFMIRLVDK